MGEISLLKVLEHLFQRKQLLFSLDRQSFKREPENALQLKWTIKRIKDYLPQSICKRTAPLNTCSRAACKSGKSDHPYHLFPLKLIYKCY